MLPVVSKNIGPPFVHLWNQISCEKVNLEGQMK